MYYQRDCVWLHEPIPMPDGKTLRHPVLIISCRAANCKESSYTAVMVTASQYRDNFTFVLEDTMFENPLAKNNCQLRLYILVAISESQIKSFANRMKIPHFRQVVKQIAEYVLSVDT